MVRLFPKTSEQIQLLGQWENESAEFDIWGNMKNPNQVVTVLLSPIAFLKYKSLLQLNKIDYEIIEENIQK